MRNSTVKKAVKWLEKARGSVRKNLVGVYNKAIDESLVEVRRGVSTGNLELIYASYAQLIWNCIGWVWSSGYLEEEDIDDDRQLFILGPSHIDLLLSYIDDLVGGEVMDELLAIMIESKSTLTVSTIDGLPSLIEGEGYKAPSFDKFLEKRKKEAKKLLT